MDETYQTKIPDNIYWTNYIGLNIPDNTYPDKIYRTICTGQNVPEQNKSDKMYRTNLPDKIYHTKYVGQNLRTKYALSIIEDQLDIRMSETAISTLQCYSYSTVLQYTILLNYL